MTALATASPVATTVRRGPRSALHGTGLMLGTQLRAARWQLLAWPAAMAILVAAIARGQAALYPTEQQRMMYDATLGDSPVSWALNGRGYELTTLGGITAYEVGFMGLLVFPIVGLHLAIRLTRHEEEAGRTELLTAGRVGRLAPLAGAVLALTLAMSGLVALTAAGLVAVGYPVGGSLRYAALLGVFTGAFAAFGLLAAELSQAGRTAYLLGVGTVLALFLLRATIDGRRASVLWPSPMNWPAEARPWGPQWRLWPYLACLGAALVLTALAFAVAARRDLYAGLLATRPGRTTARAGLGTPLGLAWRLTRGGALGWVAGMALWGAALGSLSQEMADIVADNPAMAAVFGQGRPEDLLIAMSCLLAAIAGAAVLIVGMGHLGDEEDAGRFGLLTATRLRRTRWWSTWWLVVTVESLAVQAAAGISLGLATAQTTGHDGAVTTALRAAGELAVPVLAIGAFAAAVRALAPAASWLVWVLLGWSTIVGLFATVLRIPQWAQAISPFELVGNVPLETASRAALWGLAAAAAVLFAASVAGIARRDLRAG